MNHVVGIDLGGTNIRLAVYDGASVRDGAPEPLVRRRQEVGEERRPEQLAERLGALIEDALREVDGSTDRCSVGVGLAAMMQSGARNSDSSERRGGVVAHSPHLRWTDVDFGAMLRERLGGDVPVCIENDVNAITYGEWRAGAGLGCDDLLAVFVGTGIGAGVVAGGSLMRGGSGCAAELGHVKVVYDDSARPCACGLRGCVEAYVGGTYLLRRARAELTGGARSAAVELAGGPEHVHPGHLDAAAALGDRYALDLYTEIAPLLGLALANAVTLLNPTRLILGGGVLSRTPVLQQDVLIALEIAVNPPAGAALTILPAALGDDAGLVGSALLAADARLHMRT